MKIGVIVSSKGSAIEQVLNILKNANNEIEWFAITDRDCEALKIFHENNIEYQIIQEKDNHIFSGIAKQILDENKVSFVVLFFTRLITNELFDFYTCFNIHPTLLPAFKGLNATEQVKNSKVRFIGTTLHLVNENVDDGEIIAQTCMPVKDPSVENIERYNYIQKIYLLLILIDLFERKYLICEGNQITYKSENINFTDRCNPCLMNEKYLNCIMEYQNSLGVDVIR